jgi:hypothetical protein
MSLLQSLKKANGFIPKKLKIFPALHMVLAGAHHSRVPAS